MPNEEGEDEIYGGFGGAGAEALKEERRISRMLEKAEEMESRADAAERREVAKAEAAQRWSTDVLQKHLKGAFQCFMSYWENVGGIIPDCDDCSRNPLVAASKPTGGRGVS